MTKADIAERIQTNTELSKKDSLDMLELVLSIMKDALETGEKIKVAGFGNFEIKQKKDRIGRNPQTGETITIEARKILSFKPSMLLRQAMNK
ncbi:MAG: integration host factor subunit alpha [Desulfuromonadaceae bacterium]|nr:integration host factor subunit alpha [Desulfuromonadaceae bacterium]MDD2847623.1 integration host factor subunit alpha [Desulfuromonadaceae bacterium]MDD4131131.1 integration host factor subunit alpha [Desulfuromonadaceae bacterium]